MHTNHSDDDHGDNHPKIEPSSFLLMDWEVRGNLEIGNISMSSNPGEKVLNSIESRWTPDLRVQRMHNSLDSKKLNTRDNHFLNVQHVESCDVALLCITKSDMPD